MALIGISKLQTVNQMLLSLGQMRVAALDPGGSSDAAEAEYVLDQVTREVLHRGYTCNTRKFVSITASNAGTIDLGGSPAGQSPATPAPNALRIRGVGLFEGRQFSVRGSMVYDEVKGSTTCFGTNEVVHLEIVETLTFEDIAPDVKEIIAKEAEQRYRSRKRPDPQFDQFQERDRVKVENGVTRPMSAPSDVGVVRFNPNAGVGGGDRRS